MPANKNIKVYLALSVLIVIAVSILTFFVIKGFDNLKNAPSNLTTQNELSQFYVNYEQSNTIAVVCPDSAKDNPAYAGKCNQGFYGYIGILSALDTSSREHTVYLRSGVYEINGTLPLTNKSSYINIEGENQETVILKANFNKGMLFDIYGDSGVSIRNLTLDGGLQEPILKNGSGDVLVGVYTTHHPALTIDQLIVKNFTTGLFIGAKTQKSVIVSSYFENNAVAIETGIEDEVSIGNNLFVDNNVGVFTNFPETYWPSIIPRTSDMYSYHNYYRDSYSTKKLYQNTFYSNDSAFVTVYPDKSRLINNLFAQNSFDYWITQADGSAFDIFINEVDDSDQNLLKYNFTDNPGNSIRATGYNVGSSQYPLLGNTNKSVSTVQFVSTSPNSQDFHLAPVSTINNQGDPYYLDFDLKRSTPGAYGGKCAYYERGCEYPLSGVKSSIPQTGAASSDLNGDGSVDILDIVSIIKEVFGQ